MDSEAASAQEPLAQRRASRKSVAFTEEKLVVDADGSVTMVASSDDDSRDTAQSHTPPAGADAAPADATDAAEEPAADATDAAEEPAAHEDADQLDLALMKKKKKAKKPDDEEAGDGDAAAAGDEDDAGIDLTLKKKKKKKVPKDGAEDDFAKKLEALNVEGEDGEEAKDAKAGAEADGAQEGDMDKGTGIWAHDEAKTINYAPLLSRFFSQLAERHPDHATSAARSYKIPPPQCMREGNKKTIIANLAEICKRMNRVDEHVTAFLFAELGTTGSTDGSRRLVIKGKFQQKQIESVLRTYIMEYVSCRTCRSPSTVLSKGENRLSFVTCNTCGSRRTVQAIKAGFAAQVGKRKKLLG